MPGDEAVAADLVAALETREGEVVTLVPELVPDDPATLSGFDSIVLVDVPRIRFTDRQLEALRSVTRDFGKGLVMIGGPRSYGAGGYRDTPLEAALPVEMRVRDREKQPDVALVVVIDQSGSMAACHCNTFDRNQAVQLSGVRKVDIGKEAILRAAAALQETDELGVVAFNERASWVVRRSPLGSVTDLQDRLGAIQADGQTNIYAGVEAGVKALEEAKATRRHLILLTDGWSSSGQYDEILARMKAAGITLSTVGAGGGANPFLQELATRGGGRFYDAVNPASIPDIFLKETQQVSGQQIVEERFFPAITASSPIIRGLDAGFPALLGYNGTTIKAAATPVLVSGRSDPVLAQWQYGLGRAVAWTSDATGRWARNWVAWDGFTRFFGQLVAWTFPGEESGGIEARFVTTPGGTTLRVESVGPDGSPRDFYATSVVMVDPALEQRRVDLAQVAPGVYEAPIGELTPGAYALRVTQTLAGAAAVGRTLGLVAPTPAEYRLLGTNEPLLAAIRDATGRAAGRDGRRRLAARPRHDGRGDAALALAAGPRAAALAARRLPAPGPGHAPRPGDGRGLGPRDPGPTRAGGRPAGAGGGDARGPRAGRRRGGAGGAPAGSRERAARPRAWRLPSASAPPPPPRPPRGGRPRPRRGPGRGAAPAAARQRAGRHAGPPPRRQAPGAAVGAGAGR